MSLVKAFREANKPSLIAANKADLPGAAERIEKLRKTGRTVIPCAAEAELLLRRASEHALIRYTPGDGSFEVAKPDLTPQQTRALQLVKEKVLDPYGGTGVQQAIDQAYFGLLKAIVVYPGRGRDEALRQERERAAGRVRDEGRLHGARPREEDTQRPCARGSSTPSTPGRG